MRSNIRYYNLGAPISKAQLSDCLNELLQALESIYAFEAHNLNFEQLFIYCYAQVQNQNAEELYFRVKESICNHAKRMSQRLEDEENEHLVSIVCQLWKEFKDQIEAITAIMMHLESNYISKNNLASVVNIGIDAFSQIALIKNNIYERISSIIIDSINKERGGELIDRENVKNLVNMIIELGSRSHKFYLPYVQEPLLKATKKFYKNESQKLIRNTSCDEYLSKVEIRIREEQDRVSTYLDPISLIPLQQIINQQLLFSQSDFLINVGLPKMLANHQWPDVIRMQNLFDPFPQSKNTIIKVIGQYFYNQISQSVQKIGQSEEDQIRVILDYYNQMNIIMEHVFNFNTQAAKSISQSFDEGLNIDSSASIGLATHLDKVLKNEGRRMQQMELEANIMKILALFKLLKDKDLFEQYYRGFLANRLTGRHWNQGAEILVVSQLKSECDSNYTQKLEAMFNDLQTSDELSQEFQQQQRAVLPCEFNVKVLSGNWLFVANPNITIPDELASFTTSFHKFYTQKYIGRGLTWKTNLGTADVQFKFNGKRRELLVSTYQLCILLLFNNAEVYTIQEIKNRLNVQDIEFDKHLLGLISIRVLIKESQGPILQPGESISVNLNLQFKLFRIKVPVVAVKQNIKIEETDKDLPLDAIENRNYIIDSVLVRIMKTRREMKHNDLLAEVISQLQDKFKPKPKMIKRRIENLIERQFFRRDPNIQSKYIYIAQLGNQWTFQQNLLSIDNILNTINNNSSKMRLCTSNLQLQSLYLFLPSPNNSFQTLKLIGHKLQLSRFLFTKSNVPLLFRIQQFSKILHIFIIFPLSFTAFIPQFLLRCLTSLLFSIKQGSQLCILIPQAVFNLLYLVLLLTFIRFKLIFIVILHLQQLLFQLLLIKRTSSNLFSFLIHLRFKLVKSYFICLQLLIQVPDFMVKSLIFLLYFSELLGMSISISQNILTGIYNFSQFIILYMTQ